jgi:Photosynthetic reaction centre cytochrome C subunit
MKRVVKGATVAVAIVLSAAVVGAQEQPATAGRGQGQQEQPGGRGGGRGAPQGFTNLQVFPKDVMPQQLVQTMQAFNTALGVMCDHCHVDYGRGNPMTDMASDMKPQKNIARTMMRMTQGINQQIQTAVTQKPQDQVTRVQCATCHRGQAIPQVPAPATPAAAAAGRGNP